MHYIQKIKITSWVFIEKLFHKYFKQMCVAHALINMQLTV